MKKLIFTIAAAVVPMLSLSALTIAEVRLIDSIAVQAPVVTLGEIATIETDSPRLEDKLRSLVITQAPNISNPRIVSAYKVRALIRDAGLEQDVDVHGEQCQVATETRTVDDDEMLRRISDWMDTAVSEGDEAEIDFLRLPGKWEVPAGKDVDITVESRSTVGGSMLVTLRAVHDDQVLATTRARIHVSLFRDAPVLVQPIKREELLTAEHFEVRRADITKATGMEATKPADLIGLSAKRDLKTGSLLSIKDFRKPVVIKRGSANKILVLNEPVRLSVTGAVALQSGREGETINFSNPMNKRETLKARVVRTGMAIIDLK